MARFPVDSGVFSEISMCSMFSSILQLYDERARRQLALDIGGALPTVVTLSAAATGDWTVAPLPTGLRCRKIDLGDVSPSDLKQLIAALNTSASGVQVTYL